MSIDPTELILLEARKIVAFLIGPAVEADFLPRQARRVMVPLLLQGDIEVAVIEEELSYEAGLVDGVFEVDEAQ